MLSRFGVTNFKSFKNQIILDLSNPSGYTFNPECVNNKHIKSAMLYGYNGCGKSNLALAMFDIIEHLTDKKRDEERYRYYLNADSDLPYASFFYEFTFNEHLVRYEYRKSDYETILYESLTIDSQNVIFFDRESGNTDFNVSLAGTEYLNSRISDPTLSALKYVKNNSVLGNDVYCNTFKEFYMFVEKMLFFRSLEDRTFIGLDTSPSYLIDGIVEAGLNNFEDFLRNAGLDYRLSLSEIAGKKEIMVDFEKCHLPYFEIISSGTKTLTLFYYWYHRVLKNNVPFLFIDEFDAFYHSKLAKAIVILLKKLDIQFILTTHNTSIMTNELMRPDCYFLMNKRCVRSLPECTDRELREVHNIEKIYKSGAFDE